MNTSTSSSSVGPADLVAVQVLAQLLERLEHSSRPVDPGQYRAVAESLGRALARAPAGPQLDALLQAAPAAAELYENLQYQYAGLCRTPLDAALAAEQRARDAIGRAMRAAPTAT
ncbi:hypothetical protein PY257_14170 [Ramlibacter sp. H39-3-26]|uniref:hypothetical protein n=1 Tax=Curvibacter soli TaxID=3031331 RepID=UPI0023DAE0D1|nr:hypothetical protein [Ramlibacter sp. H39-3-26]MDF1486308.1 hypothetical protein [Ramlibacter sp. H39-3-26]